MQGRFSKSGFTHFRNGNIYTVDPQNRRVTDMVIDGEGKLVYVGDSAGAEAYSGAECVDLGGKTVTPGFIESHCHPAVVAELKASGAHYIDFTSDLTAIRRAVDELTGVTPQPEYVVIQGYDTSYIYPDGRHVSASDIDDVSHGVPVILLSLDFHSVWLNTPMIKLMGYTENNIPESRKGHSEFEYICDDAGKKIGITGYVGEGMSDVFLNENMPYRKTGMLRQELKKILAEFAARGYTAIGDARGTKPAYDVLKDMDIRRELDTYFEASYVVGIEPVLLEDYLYMGSNFNIRTFKIFDDGSLEFKSMGSLEPYSDGTRVSPLFTEEELYNHVKYGLEHDCRIQIHAIGDSTQRDCLRVFERLKDYKPELSRTIAHNQFYCPEALDRYEALKDSVFCNSTPVWWIESPAVNDYLNPDRMHKGQYLIKQTADRGVRICLSSDLIVDDPFSLNPMNQIAFAVFRKEGCDSGVGGEYAAFLGPENSALTRQEALKAYTIWPAEQLGLDDITGSLEIGKNADFTVWSADFMDEKVCPDMESVTGVVPVMTVFKNKVIWRTDGI